MACKKPSSYCVTWGKGGRRCFKQKRSRTAFIRRELTGKGKRPRRRFTMCKYGR